MSAPHCPHCRDDVSEPYDFGCWRCQACGTVFAVWDKDEIEHCSWSETELEDIARFYEDHEDEL